MLIPRGPQGMWLRSHPQSHPHQAQPPWGTGSSRPGPGPPEQRSSRSSPGPDRLWRAETRLRRRLQRRAREEKVEISPGPQEVTVFGGRESFLSKEKGQMRNALRVRATAAREPPRVPPSAPLSCSLPQRPAVPGPLGAWHPSSRVLTESGAARRLPSWWVRRSDPGTRGRAGPGRGGGGEEGEGGYGHRLGTEENAPNPALGLSPPSPLRTLRSNQEEQEEEEDEQNGRRHQPGRKRGTAQARPARSPLRPAATACKRDN